jgi:replicative DNA helicase
MDIVSAKKEKKQYTPVKLPDYGKVPPQAVELEESVLGALMIEPDAFSVVSEMLTPRSFYKEQHQIIYNAIKNLGVEQKPIDLFTVQDELAKNGEIDKVGGAYFLASLTSNVVSAVHLEFHAQIIAQKHLARELIRISTEIQNNAFDASTDVDELMQDAEGKIFELSQISHKKDVLSIKDILPESIKRIEEASKRESKRTGVESGFWALDDVTSGWQRSDLIIFAGRPAMGKTSFVLNMAKNIAENDVPVAFFSLEMSNVQLVNRLIVDASELPGDKIKSGKLTKEEFGELQIGIGKLENLPLWIDDTPSLSILELRTKARKLRREHNVQIIIIDYLQLMNASGMQFSNREGEISKISRGLKALAKELDIPIIALSQLNRNLEQRGIGKDDGGNKNEAKKPQLSDLRESGAIEQDADIVCFIHRPEYYKIYEDQNGNDLRGVGQIIIAKHRNGAIKDVNLYFAQDFAKFLNDRTELERLVAKSRNSTITLLGSKTNKKQKTTNIVLQSPDNSYYEEVEQKFVTSNEAPF